jgi:2-C-methyl-D-erythritol 2,4-cyclodiphosphate synthase
MRSMSELRVGTGLDAHALEPGVPLVLGGVSFRSPRGLAGHSDGDVIAHALIDALLGAAGLGDIGTLFPSEDPELKGVSSIKLLREAYAQVRKCGFELVNADVVLIGEEPKIAPVRRQMQLSLAGALGVDMQRVSVRATTTDGLGFTGRGEGLAAQAVALLQSSSR